MNKPLNEIWKDISGFEGLYQVSDLGRIKSYDKPFFSDKENPKRKGSIKKLNLKKNGYLQVNLFKNGISKTFSVHRLVALNFIPNPENYPVVNHIDENKTNNCKINLEWCSIETNTHHGTALKRLSESKRNNCSLSIPVIQISKSGEIIAEFISANEAMRKTNINQSQISKCCNKQKGYFTAGGYKWDYKSN